MDYKTPQYPCFVCRVEDNLGQERGSQSHPINCGWRLQRENDIREKTLEDIIKLSCFGKNDNYEVSYETMLENLLIDIRSIAQSALVASAYRTSVHRDKEEE